MKISADEEESINNMASFLIEKRVLERIAQEKEANHLFPSFFGAFYLMTESDTIESLILVSEAGDFNIAELIKCRKEKLNPATDASKDKQAPPYTSAEALTFLSHIVPAFVTLEKIGLYHSDIKTNNLVYSTTRKGFLLIDFGVTKEIPSKHEGHYYLLEEFALDGTEAFNSPEKMKYWNVARANEDLEENDPKYQKLTEQESIFNPFACDMWAFGITIERMIGNTQGDKILTAVLEGIKEKDWRKRWTATRLLQHLNQNQVPLGPFSSTESLEQPFLKILREQRLKKEGLVNLQKRYQEACLPNEQLEAALAELEFVKSQFPGDEEAPEFNEVYDHLGKPFLI